MKRKTVAWCGFITLLISLIVYCCVQMMKLPEMYYGWGISSDGKILIGLAGGVWVFEDEELVGQISEYNQEYYAMAVKDDLLHIAAEEAVYVLDLDGEYQYKYSHGYQTEKYEEEFRKVSDTLTAPDGTVYRANTYCSGTLVKLSKLVENEWVEIYSMPFYQSFPVMITMISAIVIAPWGVILIACVLKSFNQSNKRPQPGRK